MKTFNVILCLFITVLSFAQSQKEIQALIRNSTLQTGLLSYYFENSESKVITQFHSDIPMVPASTWKILSTFISYSTLGEDFVFTTTLKYSGDILSDGTLEGDVVLQGDGDPTFARTEKELKAFINSCITAMKKEGIKCVDGSVIIDASVFKDEVLCPSWAWNDIGNYYSTGSWGLNVLENSVRLEYELQSNIETPPVLKSIKPKTAMHFNSRVVSGPKGSGDQAYIFGAPFQNTRIVRGSLPIGHEKFTIRGSMSCPPCFMLSELMKGMTSQNIEVGRSYVNFNSDLSQKSYSTLVVKKSLPLEGIVKEALLKSNNLFCEALLRKSTLKRFGSSDYNVVQDCINKTLDDIFPKGHKTTGQDGSGLSPFNRSTAENLSEVLHYISIEDKEFLQLLPEAKVSSLSKYLDPKIRSRVWLKSGYMSNVWTYTGTLINKQNETVFFTVMYNGKSEKGSEVRKALGKIISYMTAH